MSTLEKKVRHQLNDQTKNHYRAISSDPVLHLSDTMLTFLANDPIWANVDTG
jgi:hypothetical protein